MPRKDGPAATREIGVRRGSSEHAVKVNAGDRDRESGLEAGMDDFLTKLLCIAVLLATLKKSAKQRPQFEFQSSVS